MPSFLSTLATAMLDSLMEVSAGDLVLKSVSTENLLNATTHAPMARKSVEVSMLSLHSNSTTRRTNSVESPRSLMSYMRMEAPTSEMEE